MRFTLAALSVVGLAVAAPAAPVSDYATPETPPNGFGSNFKFPLNNGFPNPSAKAIAKVEQQAGGTLPNGPPPPKFDSGIALDFQVIATNEIFEVAFFSELLHNLTTKAPGYDTLPKDQYTYAVKAITAIKNQEELHALGANAYLAAFGYETIKPCEYDFPVATYADAIVLASTFTDLVLGALQSVEADLATAGDAAVAQLIASIIAQEGEQTGWYRSVQQKIPSSAPFLTNSNGIFAANALLQNFIVNGSCPQTLPIPALGALSVTNAATLMNSNGTAQFAVKGSVPSTYYVTYMSGQNVPVSVKIANIKTAGGATTFSAPFPFAEGFAQGLTVAAVTKTGGPFANNTAVALSSVYGPGLIEVD